MKCKRCGKVIPMGVKNHGDNCRPKLPGMKYARLMRGEMKIREVVYVAKGSRELYADRPAMLWEPSLRWISHMFKAEQVIRITTRDVDASGLFAKPADSEILADFSAA